MLRDSGSFVRIGMVVALCVFVIQSENDSIRALGFFAVGGIVAYLEYRIEVLKRDLRQWQDEEEKPKRGLPKFAEDHEPEWGDLSIASPTSYYMDKRDDEHPDGVLMERNRFSSPWVWRKMDRRE